jgi:hypothetical protein
MLGFIIPT